MNWGKIVNGVALIGAMLFCLLMLSGLVFFCIDHHRIGEIEKQVREDKPQIEWLVKTQNKQYQHNQKVIDTFRKMGRW